jgi:2-polyprenyl-3-methyl-5-hydroxy-6-metoxy-1,4-benzoquinol methylase
MQNMNAVQNRDCPVCGETFLKASLFIPENYDVSKISSSSFASRKEPEFMCHRLVECPQCDLVYVDSPPSQENLADSYHVADYDSSEEADDAALSYIKALQSTFNRLTLGSALEIGTGTGVFLEYLVKSGFTSVEGIEPSEKAIAAAPAHRLGWIKKGIFRESDYKPESFDLICCFMTMEHVRDPLLVTRAAFRLLKNGGVFVTITHDRRSWLNRCLGRLSPIIDIEHMQLFSPTSIYSLFRNAGFKNVKSKAFANTYSIHYWLRLCPLPIKIKNNFINFLLKLGIANKKVTFNVGNTITEGFKKS